MDYDIDVEYQVKNDDVFLTVGIGNGQEASSTACLDGEILTLGEIENELVGSGRDLNGKKLIVQTSIRDTRAETNRTSVTWKLKGGTQPLREIRSKEVSSSGALEVYRARFTFVE